MPKILYKGNALSAPSNSLPRYTKAQWEALDKTNLPDGFQYIITDDYSSNIKNSIASCAKGGVNDVTGVLAFNELYNTIDIAKNIYSTTEEIRIGTWADETPIYRRTFKVDSVSATGAEVYYLLLNETNISTLLKAYGSYKITDGKSYSLRAPDGSSYCEPYVAENGDFMYQVMSTTDTTFTDCIFVFEYTKIEN